MVSVRVLVWRINERVVIVGVLVLAGDVAMLGAGKLVVVSPISLP